MPNLKYNLANWVRNTTSTTGTGPLTMGGAVPGSVSLLMAFGAGTTDNILYSIQDNGVEIEAGIGSFNGTTLVFTRGPTSTLDGGVYTEGSPSPVNLVGPAEVHVTLNSSQFKEIVARLSSVQTLTTRAVADTAIGFADGETISVVGWDAPTELPRVSFAAYTVASSMPAIGVVNFAATAESVVEIPIYGPLFMDTSSWSVGDDLYVGEAAILTNVEPGVGSPVQRVGRVLTSGVSGVIFLTVGDANIRLTDNPTPDLTADPVYGQVRDWDTDYTPERRWIRGSRTTEQAGPVNAMGQNLSIGDIRVVSPTEVRMVVPEIGIDPSKVIVLVNSDVALSDLMANYYIAARGLNAAHKITKSLGTGNTVAGTDGVDAATFYTNVVLPIADYMDANDIRAIVASTNVPIFVECIPDPQVLSVSTMSVLGCARFIRDNEGAMVRAISTAIVEPMYNSIEVNDSVWFLSPNNEIYNGFQTMRAINLFMDAWSQPGPTPTPAAAVPQGHIGLPSVKAGVPAENALDTQRIIDDAVASDGVGIYGGTVHFGLNDRITPYITGYQGEIARRYYEHVGGTEKHFIDTYNVNWPLQPPPGDYTVADLLAGTLNEDAFAIMSSAIGNEPYPSPWINSYNLLVGSFGTEITSDAGSFMSHILVNGACCGMGPIQEPFAQNALMLDALMPNIMAGRSMAEAMLMSGYTFPWMDTVWGDPLYAPFKGGV